MAGGGGAGRVGGGPCGVPVCAVRAQPRTRSGTRRDSATALRAAADSAVPAAAAASGLRVLAASALASASALHLRDRRQGQGGPPCRPASGRTQTHLRPTAQRRRPAGAGGHVRPLASKLRRWGWQSGPSGNGISEAGRSEGQQRQEEGACRRYRRGGGSVVVRARRVTRGCGPLVWWKKGRQQPAPQAADLSLRLGRLRLHYATFCLRWSSREGRRRPRKKIPDERTLNIVHAACLLKRMWH